MLKRASLPILLLSIYGLSSHPDCLGLLSWGHLLAELDVDDDDDDDDDDPSSRHSFTVEFGQQTLQTCVKALLSGNWRNSANDLKVISRPIQHPP